MIKYLVRSNVIEEATDFYVGIKHVRHVKCPLECLAAYHLACTHQSREEQQRQACRHK